MLRTPLFLTALIVMMSAPAFAETEPQAVKTDNPYIAKTQEKAVEIAKSFTPVEIENLGIIKDAFGILHAVQMTNKSVSTTVKLCGKDNPEMKADMDAAYKNWYADIGSALTAKEKEMKTAINDGRFSKPKEVTAFLDLLDKTAEYTYDKMEKKPLSTPSSCESLKESMDDSAKKLGTMLAELKFPYAVPKEKPEEETPAAGAHE